MNNGLKDKVKLLMVGRCPRCGAKFTRKPPVDAAACLCKDPDATLVPLAPVISLPNAEYAMFQRLSDSANVNVETLVNAFLAEGAKEKLKELQPFPQIVVTTKES
jgi:hypothetical protein